MTNYSDPLTLGATFIPGDFDDFAMPAATVHVTSPAPQRVMQEMPGQIHDSIAALDLDGQGSQREWTSSYPSPGQELPAGKVNRSGIQTQRRPIQESPRAIKDGPSFSALPKLRDRTPNVPPTYEEKEVILERARGQVLASPDAEAQLSWAQDALSYVDTCVEHESRLAQFEPARTVMPHTEQQIRTDALSIVQFLADQEHPRALFIKGIWLEFGKFGFQQDRSEAFRCYKRSAARGYSRAEYRMGMQYEFTNETVKALKHYKTGEAHGDAASCYRVGMMALLGQLGQPQDYGTAIRLIRQAADAADENAPQGSYVYGMLQARELPNITVPEIFLPLDMGGARRSIEKAAYLGFSKAQLKMGSAYELCSLGCDFNPVLSLHYNALAAQQGEPEAEMSISKWFLCGHDGLFHKNEELAFRYAQRAAATGLPTAEFAMGYFYEIGMYVPVDLAKAVNWYEKAAKDGNLDARGRIEGISKSRTLSKRDHEDIAVSRIKSQHGSRRGMRPERFTKTTTPMPSIPDEGARSTKSQQDIGTKGPRLPTEPTMIDASRHERSVSITPYPLDDRPGSDAPYPTTDSFQCSEQGPRPAGGFLNVSLDQKPPSVMVEGRSNATSAIQSSLWPARNGRGRDRTPERAGHLPVGRLDRAVSEANAGRGHIAVLQSTTLQPSPAQSHRQASGLVQTWPLNDMTAPHPGPPLSDRLDIGFSAPVDPRANQRNKVSPPADGYQRRQESRRAGASTATHQSQPMRRPAAQPSSSQVRAQSMGDATRVHSSNAPAAAALRGPSDPKISTTSPPKPGGPARAPGKGPQTFEEMGVPTGKHENECIIM